MRSGFFCVRLTVMFALAVVLVAMCGGARAQDVPPAHRDAAQQAFAEGYAYYIWYEGAEPVVLENVKLDGIPGTNIGPQSVGALQMSFRYLAADERARPPFLIRTSAVASRGDNTPVRKAMISQEATQPATSSGTAGTMFGTVDGTTLSGEGQLEVVLLDAPGKAKTKAKAKSRAAADPAEPRQLSNTLRVRLVCHDN